MTWQGYGGRVKIFSCSLPLQLLTTCFHRKGNHTAEVSLQAEHKGKLMVVRKILLTWKMIIERKVPLCTLYILFKSLVPNVLPAFENHVSYSCNHNEPLEVICKQIQNISNELLYSEGTTQFLLQLQFNRQFIVVYCGTYIFLQLSLG